MTIRQNSVLCVLLVIIGGWYVLTIRGGHEWGDDFSLYIQHAHNLVIGRAYNDTGYLYNPRNATIGPATFPPVFPAILAPVYAIFGLHLTAMKIELIILFLAALWVIVRCFQDDLPFLAIFALVNLLGWNPYFGEFKDQILSDIPFLLFVYWGLLLIERNGSPIRPRQGQLQAVLVTGGMIYLAYGTRSLGLILIPALWGYELVRWRRISWFTIGTTGVLASLMVLQGYSAHNDRSYLDQFASVNGPAILRNLREYVQRTALFWDNGLSRFGRHALLILTSSLAAWGLVIRIKRGLTIFECFVFGYLMLIIVFPFSQMRYLIPVFPLYLHYMLLGVLHLPFLRSVHRQRAALIVVWGLIMAAYIGKYTQVEYGNLKEGIAKPETQALFDFIRRNTEHDAVCIFRKPRALALFTDRNVGMYHYTQTDQELVEYFRSIGVTYIIESFMDEPYFKEFVGRQRATWTIQFVNADFTVYQM